jgi:hypothetical protein
MSENAFQDERVHTEAPAEGDPDADTTEIRVHTQDPAEGADYAEPQASTKPAAADTAQ